MAPVENEFDTPPLLGLQDSEHFRAHSGGRGAWERSQLSYPALNLPGGQ